MSARALAHALAGYLCGTRRTPPDLAALATAHRALSRGVSTDVLTSTRWTPPAGAEQLHARLAAVLDSPGVVDLVLFGSQAHGGTTGFSDVDAVLVIDDAVAEDPAALRDLRSRVLAAQRAVIAYQPMQHHGFEVATQALLECASASLGMPPVALADARSLLGRETSAGLREGPSADERRQKLHDLVEGVLAVRRWPRHPWQAHRLVSMFELVPALYVQARGRDVPKRESFAEARRDFAGDWAYDDLREIRSRWPRRRRPVVTAATRVTRNPWLAVAAWRRLPVRPLVRLEPALLERLRANAQAMAARAL